jgi:hypothetical protein
VNMPVLGSMKLLLFGYLPMADILDKLDLMALHNNGTLHSIAADAAAEIRRLRVDLQRATQGLPAFSKVRMADDFFANSHDQE